MPGIHRPGGFTITSPPSKARGRAAPPEQPGPATQAAQPPFLELAVQRSPDNVVARWLWQPTDAILSAQLHVRVGGSFVWPPPGVMPTVGCRLVLTVDLESTKPPRLPTYLPTYLTKPTIFIQP